MKFYKIVFKGYVLGVGTGDGGTEITESEYNNIMTAIQNRPKETDTIAYRLKEDLTWEPYEVESTPDEEPNPTEEERLDAYDILMGLKE